MTKRLTQPPKVVYEFLDDPPPPITFNELVAQWLTAQRARRGTVVSSDEVGENTNTPTPRFFL
jgi:hypothetical protein